MASAVCKGACTTVGAVRITAARGIDKKDRIAKVFSFAMRSFLFFYIYTTENFLGRAGHIDVVIVFPFHG